MKKSKFVKRWIGFSILNGVKFQIASPEPRKGPNKTMIRCENDMISTHSTAQLCNVWLALALALGSIGSRPYGSKYL